MSRLDKASGETISDDLIEYVIDRLAQDKPVRRTLPMNGRLHIDRPLPFLIVYRQRRQQEDDGARRLVLGEASYLITSANRRLGPSVAKLIEAIAGMLAERFGAFLIVEIWAAADEQAENDDVPSISAPAFRIFTSKARIPTRTVEAMEKSLARIKILKQSATVEINYGAKRSPHGLPALLSPKSARAINGFVLGLEVKPVYRDPASGEIFPLVLRALHAGLARCFKRASFAFTRAQTTYQPSNHQVLGRRAVVKAVWEVDRRLAEISNAYDFLLQVTPVNTERAWSEFKRGRYQREPEFYYRPLPIDPAAVKGRLYQIPIGRVEDPTLAALFRQQQTEIDRQLSMLGDRGNRRFLYGSLQLYGGVTDELRQTAEELLTSISSRSRESASGRTLDAAAFARRAQDEIRYYRELYPDLTAKVQIRDDIVGLMVSQGNLLIGRQTKIDESRVEALLQHEVGTHVLTYFNGRAQPFQQLRTGLAGYEELQEGLAVLAEYLVGGLNRQRLRLLAGRVVAVQSLIDGGAFVDTYRLLNKKYGFKQRTAFMVSVRVFRGGGLTKDVVYLSGLVALLKYIEAGRSLEPLFVGKAAADHIPIIQELQLRHILNTAPLRPRYLDEPQSQERLEALRRGSSVIGLCAP